jgi:hypothetical protein
MYKGKNKPLELPKKRKSPLFQSNIDREIEKSEKMEDVHLKFLVIIAALFLAALMYLQSQGILNVNWTKLQAMFQPAMSSVLIQQQTW